MRRLACFLARRKGDGSCLCWGHRGFFRSATCLAVVGMICTLSAQKILVESSTAFQDRGSWTNAHQSSKKWLNATLDSRHSKAYRVAFLETVQHSPRGWSAFEVLMIDSSWSIWSVELVLVFRMCVENDVLMRITLSSLRWRTQHSLRSRIHDPKNLDRGEWNLNSHFRYLQISSQFSDHSLFSTKSNKLNCNI